jgi:hypothetical protein
MKKKVENLDVKCTAKNCPFKEHCFRYTSSPKKDQFFFKTPPFSIEHQKPECEMFMGYSHLYLFIQIKAILTR